MVTTPAKRTAADSPENLRPSKKQAISSPEEGELDSDTTPPPAPPTRTPARSSSPSPTKSASKFENKVPFPFKKKESSVAPETPTTSATEPRANGSEEGSSRKKAPAVYERSEEDARRIREAEERESTLHYRRRPSAAAYGPRPAAYGDHWEPVERRAWVPAADSYYRPHDRDWIERDKRRPGPYDAYPDSNYSYRDREYDRDLDRRPYDSRSEASHSHRDREVGRDAEREAEHKPEREPTREPEPERERTREPEPEKPRKEKEKEKERIRTASPSSPECSQSPRSPSVSSHKEKHRLPPSRGSAIREPSPPPPARYDHVDSYRPRDRDYDDRYADDRHYGYSDRYYSRDPRGHYRRTPPPDLDFEHYRSRDRDHIRDHRDRDYDWRYGDSYVPDRRGRYDDDRDRRRYSPRPPPLRELSPYRLVSPTLPPSRRTHTPPYRPQSPSYRPGRISRPQSPLPSTPPPPASPPPPSPPPVKDEVLQDGHPTVSIAIPVKKPGAPVPRRTPPPSITGDEKFRDEERPKDEDDSKSKREDEHWKESGRVVAQRRRREPVHRTREEEMDAYGRTFMGCGRQSDYEVLTKLGEGTFGEVHKAINKQTGTLVALKRILMHNEKEGMPVTALREIKILKALRHPCIVNILDMFVVRSKERESPLSVYMVFPYMDHDLAGLLENERVKLQPSQIKLYMKQLLEGTEYMHRNHILHRDMKAANLLISNTGSLRIADFGLARSYDPNIVRGHEFKVDRHGRERKYTNCVVTRWYRPPELLLGARQYGGEVDIWGTGCVLGEMFWRRPILPGTSDLDQLDKIWQLCGSPNQQNWPNYDQLPGCEGVKRFPHYSRRLKQVYETIGPETCDLLDKLLTCNPRERITAAEALDHDYFWTDPLPADPKSLPTYEASHEFDKRGRRNQAPAGPPMQVSLLDPQQRPMPVQPPPLNFNNRGSYHPNGRYQGPPAPYPPPPPPYMVPPPANVPFNVNNQVWGKAPFMPGPPPPGFPLPPPPHGFPPRPLMGGGVPRYPSGPPNYPQRFHNGGPPNGGLNYG